MSAPVNLSRVSVPRPSLANLGLLRGDVTLLRRRRVVTLLHEAAMHQTSIR